MESIIWEILVILFGLDFLLFKYGKDIILANTIELVRPVFINKCLTNDILLCDRLLKGFFGVLKEKWRVLREKPKYNIQVQRIVVAVIMALHNFIRLSNLGDVDFNADYTNGGNGPTEDSDSDENEEHNNTHLHYIYIYIYIYIRHLISNFCMFM